MWNKLKWGLRILLVLIVGAFLHYTMPQRDVVRISNTYNKLTQVGANWMFYSGEDVGTGVTENTLRDIRFIDAVFPDGSSVMVYRNEDTGWLWPPYFKWDSSTLQAEGENYKSDKANPQWVAITHYGWRIPFISIYPNAVRIVPVEGPDVSLFPWLNIVILALLAFVALFIRAMWRQFRERTVDPTLDRAGDAWDRVDARADAAAGEVKGLWGRFTGWLGTFRAKPRR
jgi:hypothetical protein